MRELITSGNQLVALGMLDAGCRFFAGYPITPSSEIMHTLATDLPANGGVCIQMEDEISSISAALGASMSGVKSATASSGPGLSLKSEQIGLGFMAEVPLVIVDVMRGGPSTGLPTRTSQGDISFLSSPTHGDFCPIIICPSTLEECYYKTIEAFNLAERFSTPVFLVLDETLGHMYSKVNLKDAKDLEIINRRSFAGEPSSYRPYDVGPSEPAILMPFFRGYRYHITGNMHGLDGFPSEDATISTNLINRLFSKIETYAKDIEDLEIINPSASDFIIAYGSVALAARVALQSINNASLGLIIVKNLFPIPKSFFSTLKAQNLYIVEMNKGQYYLAISAFLSGTTKTHFIGKFNGRLITPEEIINFIKESK